MKNEEKRLSRPMTGVELLSLTKLSMANRGDGTEGIIRAAANILITEQYAILGGQKFREKLFNEALKEMPRKI